MYNSRAQVESGYTYKDGIWSGGEPNYEKLIVSLGSFLYRKLYNRRNEIFQIDPNTKTEQTCGAVRVQAINFAIYLKQMKNLNAADVMAFCAYTDKYSIVLVLAAIFLGVAFVCIDPKLDSDEINRIINTIKPTVIICETECLPNFENLPINIVEKGTNFDLTFLSPPENGKDFAPESVDAAKTILLYVCTAGSAIDVRRIVPYTQNFVYNTLFRMQNIVTNHDILLSILPFVNWEAIWSLLYCLVFGSTHIASNWSTSTETLKLIQRYEVTSLNIDTKNLTFICINPKLDMYRQMKQIRFIWTRGKSCPIEQMKFMRSILECTHIVNCYACAETGSYVSHFDPTYEYDMNIMKVNSVGRLRRGCQAMIVDIETRKPLGPNEDGELLLKVEDMPQKYYSPEDEPNFTQDGWFMTGDYAKFDAEQCLYVVSRIECMLHLESQLISPHDIEYIILKIPTIRSCCVVGIPDPVFGELPAAFVVKEPNSEVTENNIIKTVALQGQDYQRLRGGVYFLPEIPTSVVGEVIRRKLRDKISELPPNKSCKCGI